MYRSKSIGLSNRKRLILGHDKRKKDRKEGECEIMKGHCGRWRTAMVVRGVRIKMDGL